MATNWAWLKNVQKRIKMAAFVFLNAFRARTTTRGFMNTPGTPTAKCVCRRLQPPSMLLQALGLILTQRSQETQFVQMPSLSQCSLAGVLLLGHTFYYKGEGGRGKERRKEGREGRRKVPISGSVNLSVQLRPCMMKSESHIFRWEAILNNKMMVPVQEDTKSISTWKVKGLGTGSLCYSKQFFPIWKKRHNKTTTIPSIWQSPFQK